MAWLILCFVFLILAVVLLAIAKMNGSTRLYIIAALALLLMIVFLCIFTSNVISTQLNI